MRRREGGSWRGRGRGCILERPSGCFLVETDLNFAAPQSDESNIVDVRLGAGGEEGVEYRG